jgi:hypothetical protein
MLVAADITFDSCGCNGPGPRPRTLADAKTQLQQRRTHRKHHTVTTPASRATRSAGE